MIVVELIQIGVKTERYEISNNPTIKGLLDTAGVGYEGVLITINDNPVGLDKPLRDGDRVVVGRMMKGNVPFIVEFVRLGAGTTRLPAEDGMTIESILEQASPDQRLAFYDQNNEALGQFRDPFGNPVDDSYVVQRPANGGEARIMLTTMVKGNRSL